MFRLLRNIAAIVIALALVLFSIRSTDRAEIGLFPLDWTVSLPAYLLLFAGLFFGLILAWVVPLTSQVSRRMQLRRANQKIRALEAQIAELQQFKNEVSAEKVRQMTAEAETAPPVPVGPALAPPTAEIAGEAPPPSSASAGSPPASDATAPPTASGNAWPGGVRPGDRTARSGRAKPASRTGASQAGAQKNAGSEAAVDVTVEPAEIADVTEAAPASVEATGTARSGSDAKDAKGDKQGATGADRAGTGKTAGTGGRT
ncbi:putative integral membrane protein [Rhodothalassium salexigens DSM 2132]|uniref:Putative integral membrane protein n=1 Tax=Rhodothalassium salexigens DSM 2132 TaxID=1188247 RepID=A0A4R2PGI4_RHOSA|nr:LapA family protein [Rhodothalassium salexigens]MBB4211589.1 putative integral membrane protein [Rhodothalassium salexigens DSM 2132]MBK1638391.1 hypothetical protein [Rhodothalassium salexigens DSM 2132]TCP34479.1 putative integral membrane protein [Rhodothalassium salexigens DSM 2132]